ncbi:hypothetical protein CBR_g48829 [Chara braunii]|uniref:Reverse transcriptase domain-containing protein n=1 Tax=Chara braunii TaxID=69332 RepID=A0A388M3S9_CHABU|nr:hypothetical protein CBR_g48829 [Chara braunii]|eukprot:GBG89119.1 hypothetical protein CBR_g48829 [Chara braunii]
MLAWSTETKKRADDAAAAAKKKAEDAERARLLAIEQQRQHDEAATRAADEERQQRREKIFTREQALLTMAAEWRTEAENSQLEDSANKIALLLSHLTDFLATCITQQEEIHGLDNSLARVQDRLQRLEQRPVAAADASSSNTSDRLNALEMDIGSLKDGVKLQQTATQQLQERICTTANTSSSEPRETTPKFDGQEIFCDSMKTYPDAWFRKFELTLQLHNVKEHKHHAYLYSRSGGACQAWLDNLLSKYRVVANDLQTKLSWDDLKAAWHKRFQVELLEIKAMDKLMVFEQGTLPSTDWIAEYQRLTSVGQASCSALLDSGASRNFMSQSFMQRADLGAQVRRKANPTAIKLADGKTQQLLDRYIEAVPVYFAPHACEPVTFDILDTDFDIILGMPWLASADHTVNFHRRTLSVRDAFGAEVACTIPLPHTSIRCQVVTAKSFRATCAYEQPKEIGLCFLRTVAVADFSPTDLSSDPRVVRLLDEFAEIFESPTGVVPDRPISHEIILEAGAVPMTNEFRAMLDRFVLVYIDDILVYSRSLEDHLGHLRRVLEMLRHAKYKANRDRCEFAQQELENLGHFVTPEGISPLSDKIQAVQEWPEPRNVTDVRSFLGLTGYYQRFIKGYSKTAAHLNKLQCEDRPFDFGEEARGSFFALKAALLSAEVLRIYDPLSPTRVTTDASGYGIGAVLEQHDGVDWHPVEYFSKKVPIVHSIDDARKKELLAFVHALKRCVVHERGSVGIEELFPEFGEKAGVTITDDILGEAVVSGDMVEEENGNVFGVVRGGIWDEVSAFGFDVGKEGRPMEVTGDGVKGFLETKVASSLGVVVLGQELGAEATGVRDAKSASAFGVYVEKVVMERVVGDGVQVAELVVDFREVWAREVSLGVAMVERWQELDVGHGGIDFLRGLVVGAAGEGIGNTVAFAGGVANGEGKLGKEV